MENTIYRIVVRRILFSYFIFSRSIRKFSSRENFKMFRICFLEINWTGDTTIRWNFPGTLVIVILRFKGIVDVGVFFFDSQKSCRSSFFHSVFSSTLFFDAVYRTSITYHSSLLVFTDRTLSVCLDSTWIPRGYKDNFTKINLDRLAYSLNNRRRELVSRLIEVFKKNNFDRQKKKKKRD